MYDFFAPLMNYFRQQVGLRADAASAAGSLHAKLADLVPRVQRGVAASSGNITITAIDPNRSIVLSWSKASTGRVGTNAITGTLAWGKTETTEGPASGTTSISLSQSSTQTDIFVKVYSAKIVNATTVNVDGACWWEVIEF